MMGWVRWLTVTSALAIIAPSLRADTIRAGFDSDVMPATDDDASPEFSIGFTANFYGATFSSLFVNNNGNFSVGVPFPDNVPVPLNTLPLVVIAPFFGNVDTSDPGSAVVTYGVGLVDGHLAFGATWPGVGYYAGKSDLLNEFQGIIIDRSDTGIGNFDIEFNYRRIEWDYGDPTGKDGSGQVPAVVGLTNGIGFTIQLPGSLDFGQFVDGGPSSLVTGSNVGVPGRLVYEIRNPDTSGPIVPTPGAAGLALGGFALFLRVRRRFG